MNATNDNFTTPKQTKRLGLRRSSSILRNSAKKDTGTNTKSKFLELATTPVTIAESRLPQSDVIVNYKQLEQNGGKKETHAVTTPGTPKNNSGSHLQRQPVSTNCRPYRLALSKRVREKMTKKRLEFCLANEMEKQEAEVYLTQDQHKTVAEENPDSKKELLEKIEVARKELNSRQEHVKKVQELQEAINVWKSGFSSALQDLQQKIEPRLETATLLDRLHIPQELIKYIND